MAGKLNPCRCGSDVEIGLIRTLQPPSGAHVWCGGCHSHLSGDLRFMSGLIALWNEMNPVKVEGEDLRPLPDPGSPVMIDGVQYGVVHSVKMSGAHRDFVTRCIVIEWFKDGNVVIQPTKADVFY